MQSIMIRIENSAKMEAAIDRCKKNHPKVRRVDAKTVTVYGSNGNAYTVRFSEPRAGLKLACCDCKAGQAGQLCYHIAGALAAPAAPVVPAIAPKLVKPDSWPINPPLPKAYFRRQIAVRRFCVSDRAH